MRTVELPEIGHPAVLKRRQRIREKLYAMKKAQQDALRAVWAMRRQCAGGSKEYEELGRLVLLIQRWPFPGP
jgi:hypothetical protein